MDYFLYICHAIYVTLRNTVRCPRIFLVTTANPTHTAAHRQKRRRQQQSSRAGRCQPYIVGIVMHSSSVEV